MCFCRKKKKNHALMIIAIVVASLAAAAGAYVLFTKVLKDKLFKKNAVEDADACDEIADEIAEDEVLDTAEEMVADEEEA